MFILSQALCQLLRDFKNPVKWVELPGIFGPFTEMEKIGGGTDLEEDKWGEESYEFSTRQILIHEVFFS